MSDLKPLFATPCYGGLVTWQYATSMVNLADSFKASNVPFRTYMIGGDSVVDRARNDCVAEFLEGDCTHLFFIDSDLSFAPQDALDTLTSGLDFVLAPYRKKTLVEKWTTTVHAGQTVMRFHPGSRAIRYIMCAEGGAGFLCMSRAAVLRLTEGVQTYDGSNDERTRRCPDLFRSVVDGDARIGEDQYVCRRWRALGEIVWCSIDAKLAHVGTGETFEGDYAAFLQLSVQESAD